MILSQACQYGLQATIYLAVQGDTPVLSKDIATQLGIPPHFLAKILQELSKRGLLLSIRGRGGGFKLSRDPNPVRFTPNGRWSRPRLFEYSANKASKISLTAPLEPTAGFCRGFPCLRISGHRCRYDRTLRWQTRGETVNFY